MDIPTDKVCESGSMEQQDRSYLALLEGAKKSLAIPVIASINCYRDGTWLEYAKRFIDLGADAVELNCYVVAADHEAEGRRWKRSFSNWSAPPERRSMSAQSERIGCAYSSLANLLRRFDEEEWTGSFCSTASAVPTSILSA